MEQKDLDPSPRDGTVTLVITCFNHARFLAEAIDSALTQRRPFDQILLIDDGSTDDTREVASRYQSIAYVRQENQGLSAARNAGLARAIGAFIIFLDADDRLLPDAVGAGLDCFARNEHAALVFGRFQQLRATGLTVPSSAPSPRSSDSHAELLRFNFISMHATVMYRRALIQALGGFDPKLRAAEDYDLYLRITLQHPIASHENVIAHYRKHDGNMSQDARLMLRATRLVLTRHRATAKGNPERQRSYREGLRNWQNHFGTKLGAQIVKGTRQGVSRWSLVSDAFFMVFNAPQAFLKHRAIVLQTVFSVILARLPTGLRTRIAARYHFNYLAPRGRANLGDLKRREPFCRNFGFSRGTPVDRYYIEAFLGTHETTIRGRVLEIGDDGYTRKFGGPRVTRSDVLNVNPDVPGTSLVGDLEAAGSFPDEAFDCIIATQTLHLIWDVQAAVATLHRMLRPGGTLLLTVPGTISQLESGRWKETWFWGFGPVAIERLFAKAFPSVDVSVGVHGNALASVAFLEGLAMEELSQADLDHRDEQYPLLITVRARR